MLSSVASLALLLLTQVIALPSGTSQSFSEDLQKRSTPHISLGTASQYAVFGFSGISTVAGTIVNGDIGVSPIAITAITGFGAVVEGKSNTHFVTGNIHAPPYATTTTAHRDIIAAYKAAIGLTATGHLAVGDSLGGATLTPGVYASIGAISLGVAEYLTLDAQGDPAAVFVIRAGGAITTGAHSGVVFLNGATPANVFWVTPTNLVTGVASSFSGIILTGTDVVIAGVLNGAVYAQTAIALHAATINPVQE